MSRYPGSQFIVIDNTATTATVPVTTKNPAAPTYMTSFHSIKGPEEIKTVYGNDFFTIYMVLNQRYYFPHMDSLSSGFYGY